MTRRLMVAVIGAGQAPVPVLQLARELGTALIEAGFRVVSGGRGGVMQAVSEGARSASEYREGDVVGIVPGDDARDANPFVDIVIVSGMGIMRNALLVRSADAVVAVAGGAGTLSELAMAWQLDKPIIALEVAGWSGRLAGERIDDRPRAPILGASRVEDVIAALRALG
ncbi:MAG: TIGR00725 family protein [Polyangiaceae bacterium]